VTTAPESLPSDLAAAHAMILAERTARVQAGSGCGIGTGGSGDAKADLSSRDALIAHLKLEIEKLRRSLYGAGSERKARLLEQMELAAGGPRGRSDRGRAAAQNAAARTQRVSSFERKRPSRKPFPSTYRANASSSPRRNSVPAADRRSCRSWARTSPRRWR